MTMKTYRHRFKISLLISILLHGSLLVAGILYPPVAPASLRAEDIYEVSDTAEELAVSLENYAETSPDQKKKRRATQIRFFLLDAETLPTLSGRTEQVARQIREEKSKRENTIIPVVKNPAEKPRLISYTPIPYPAEGGGAAGTVVVCILVGYEGRPEYTSLAESSGNRFLDAAAVERCITWRFTPARDSKGRIVRCLVYIPITIKP